MIYEYTIEPDVIILWASSTRDYKDFLDRFGLGTSRFVSSFPKSKKGKLRSYLLSKSPSTGSEFDKLRYVEMITFICERIICREVIINSGAQNTSLWSAVVRGENEKNQFDVVISTNDLSLPNNVTPENMYDDIKYSIWQHEIQRSFQRTRVDLTEHIKTLFRYSTEQIVIVDPYCYKTNSLSFLAAIINTSFDKRLCQELPKIKIIYKDGYKDSLAAKATHTKRELLSKLNKNFENISLGIVVLKENKESKKAHEHFHNRYILTEHGGVSLGIGTDLSENEYHTDEITLLSKKVYKKRYRQFVEDCVYDIIDEI